MNANDPSTSEELLTRALAGEAAAFGMLVRAHQAAIYSLALRMLSDRHEAEDLAQEVFLGLHRNLACIESAAHLEFWLRKVTLNRAIDRLRRRPRSDLSLEDAGVLICDPTDSDPLLQRRLRALLAQLPPAPRAVGTHFAGATDAQPGAALVVGDGTRDVCGARPDDRAPTQGTARGGRSRSTPPGDGALRVTSEKLDVAYRVVKDKDLSGAEKRGA